MTKTLLTSVLVFVLSFFAGKVVAQEVTVELGSDQIGLNETFTIKISVANEKIKSYDQFPDIPGFQKQGVSQSSSMNVINGQVTSSNSIIQYYKPTKKGEFQLPSFSININGQNFDFPGKKNHSN